MVEDDPDHIAIATAIVGATGQPLTGLRIWCSPSSRGLVLNLTRTVGADSWTGIGYIREQGIKGAVESALVQLDVLGEQRNPGWAKDKPTVALPRRGYR